MTLAGAGSAVCGWCRHGHWYHGTASQWQGFTLQPHCSGTASVPHGSPVCVVNVANDQQPEACGSGTWGRSRHWDHTATHTIRARTPTEHARRSRRFCHKGQLAWHEMLWQHPSKPQAHLMYKPSIQIVANSYRQGVGTQHTPSTDLEHIHRGPWHGPQRIGKCLALVWPG